MCSIEEITKCEDSISKIKSNTEAIQNIKAAYVEGKIDSAVANQLIAVAVQAMIHEIHSIKLEAVSYIAWKEHAKHEDVEDA